MKLQLQKTILKCCNTNSQQLHLKLFNIFVTDLLLYITNVIQLCN